MYDHVREAVEKGEVLLELDPTKDYGKSEKRCHCCAVAIEGVLRLSAVFQTHPLL